MRVALILLLLLGSSEALSYQDPGIKVLVEEPVEGETYSGISNLRGWAVSPNGTGSYTFPAYIDGQFAFHLIPGGARADVGRVFPDFPNSDSSGFSMAFNYKDLPPGEHVLEVYAYDNAMNFNVATVTFTTERFVSGFIGDSSKIDVSTAESVSIYDKHSFLVAGPTIEGRRWDFLLSWDSASQGFKAEGIEPFGTYFSGGDAGVIVEGASSDVVGDDERGGSWSHSLSDSRRGISDTRSASAGLGVLACVTSVTQGASTAGDRVVMDNGLVAVAGGVIPWEIGEVHFVFRTEMGHWYSMVWEGHYRQLDIVQEPSDCLGAPYFISGEVREFGSNKIYVFSNAEVEIPSTCGIMASDPMQVHVDQNSNEYLVSLRTGERCPVTAVVWT